MNCFRFVRFVVVSGLALLSLAAVPPSPSSPTAHAGPRPPLRDAELPQVFHELARQEGIRLYHVADGEKAAAVGDAIVLWVGARDRQRTRHWLIRLERAETSAREARSFQGETETKYLSWGPVVEFAAEPETFSLWIAGPVVMPDPVTVRLEEVPVKRRRITVPGNLLRLGLHEAALVDLHIQRQAQASEAAGHPLPLAALYSLDEPIRRETVRHNQQIASAIGLTETMSRAWVGGYVALHAFYESTQDVPELREIAEVALQKPRFWQLPKLAFGGGIKTAFGGSQTRVIDASAVGLLPVATEAYTLAFGLSQGEAPVVFGEMAVTWPTPPLDVSAGILGLVAVHPKHPERMVEMMLISAERGEPAVPPQVASRSAMAASPAPPAR